MDVGVEINQYKIIEHIGRGGMADVWSARDQRLNRMVAIKTIAHGLSQDADPVGLFKQEAQTIAQMEHPHILPIYDFGEFQGQLYIVMRYVAGGSLEDILRRGPLSVTEALRMGQAVAQALDYAHSNKVIHLDLKPPNVLLDSHNSPYLADFGLATVLDREGKASNPGSGTLLYMAPEQLTAEVIDHRADVYSFTIVLFHMLTGQLPFEGGTPLALKQLQFREELPDVDIINPALPTYLSDILRRGTAVNPSERPETLMAIIEEMQDVLAASSAFLVGDFKDEYEVSEVNPYTMTTEPMGVTDLEILEAVDIYSRARHAWAGGNGRFLLGVTHFMMMNGYYMDAERHGLELDEPGMQMLLRGALEYDHEVQFWWNKMNDDNRRWVCLHAVRSGNTPARVRAMYRLETLPDAEKPQIPKLVAQALQVETNEEARLAALQVLGTRAKLMAPAKEYRLGEAYRGLMLTTMTRLGIQIDPASEWQEVVYTPEIDLLIAEIAVDNAMPRVAEFAARIIGRIRSKTAVRYIANQQRAGRKGALRALALVRDETPNLPPVVSPQARLYAWMTNTLRRMFDKPLHLVWRYLFALFGGWLAMGIHVWVTFRSQAIFTPQRWGNSLAIGLIYGLFVGLMVLFAGEFSARLRGFWPNWVRGVTSVLIGFVIGTVAWGQFTWFYLQYPPDWELMQFGGFGLAFGIVVTALFNLRSYISIPLTAVATYLPMLIVWRYYFFYEVPQLSSVILVGLALAAILLLPVFTQGSRSRRMARLRVWAGYVGLAAVVLLLGLIFNVATIFDTERGLIFLPNVDFIVFVLVALTVAIIVEEYFNIRKRPVLLLSSILGYAVGMAVLWRYGFDSGVVHLIRERQLTQDVALIYYDDPNQIYTLGIVFALMIGLGGHLASLIADIMHLISRSREEPVARPAPRITQVVPKVAVSPGSKQLFVEPEPKVAVKPQARSASLATELDPNLDNFGLTRMDEEEAEAAATREDFAASRGRREMMTELDPLAARDEEPSPSEDVRSGGEIKRVNLGTGIKIRRDLTPGNQTELDVNKGRPEDEK